MMNLYVIGAEAGPYKVGKTNDLERRRAALQTGNPHPLKVHFSIQAESVDDLERNAHRALAGFNLTGEWFDAPLSDIIEAIEAAGAVVTVSPTTMTPEAFCAWLMDMRTDGLARSDAECARQLGLSANSVVAMKRNGADKRTALACRALLHRLEPYA